MNHQFQIRIATRASQLAIWQSNLVASLLKARNPKLQVELVKLVTEGDRKTDIPLSKVGGKALFIKELEVAMLENRADIAVHSMKDIPNQLPLDFSILAILERADTRDVLVSNEGYTMKNLPVGARVGTSSLRRTSQLLAIRPDLVIRDLRGNVTTRLAKQRDGTFDAIVLAAAGLKRLGLYDKMAVSLSISEVLPAVGQGAIGIEALAGGEQIAKLLAPLNDSFSSRAVLAERAFSSVLNGSCQAAIGALAEVNGENLALKGVVAAPDGSEVIRLDANGLAESPESVGKDLGSKMLKAGADRLLELS